MATIPSSSSPVPKSGPRRLPAPCWSDEETVALIQVYRDKWYSLRRGNLRAPDWQEVADGVAGRCSGHPPKTSIQCRHKMEKLRKRYRAEVQRIGNVLKGNNRYKSSWVHFKLMDDLELGFCSSDDAIGNRRNKDDDRDDEDEDGDEDEDVDGLVLYPKGVKQAIDLPNQRFQGSIGTGNGVRIKIPNFGPGMDRNNRLLDDLPPTMNPNYGSGKGSRDGLWKEGFVGGGMKRKEKDDGNVMNEMVLAIQRLGEAFVKTEKMKMDMARELESMRMKAELKQTEIILETHRKLWDTLSETVVERKEKKVKRMPTPES